MGPRPWSFLPISGQLLGEAFSLGSPRPTQLGSPLLRPAPAPLQSGAWRGAALGSARQLGHAFVSRAGIAAGPYRKVGSALAGFCLLHEGTPVVSRLPGSILASVPGDSSACLSGRSHKFVDGSAMTGARRPGRGSMLTERGRPLHPRPPRGQIRTHFLTPAIFFTWIAMILSVQHAKKILGQHATKPFISMPSSIDHSA